MNADCREQVFAALREKGLRAIKVVAADGSKANGEIRGVRKRVGVLVAMVPAAVAGVVVFFTAPLTRGVGGTGQAGAFDDKSRRQVIGHTAIIEKGIKTGWAEVFEFEGERFFASFAIPGVPAGLRNTTEKEIAESLERMIGPSYEDGIEARQIKTMVEGMKDEARRFIAKGGSIRQYCHLLVCRQEEELGYYNRAKAEIENAQKSDLSDDKLIELWEKRNNELRQMGVKLVPLPE